MNYLTFSHERNTWLMGKPGVWLPITAIEARMKAELGYIVLDRT